MKAGLRSCLVISLLAGVVSNPGCAGQTTDDGSFLNDDNQWITDFRGSDFGHLEGARVDHLPRDRQLVDGKTMHANPSSGLVFWTSPDGVDDIILEDRNNRDVMQRMVYLPTWKKGRVLKVMWPSDSLYFEQERDGGRLVAHCLVDLKEWRFVYVRVHTPER